MSWEREELNSVIYIHTREEMIEIEFFNNFFEKRDFIKGMPIEMFCSVPYALLRVLTALPTLTMPVMFIKTGIPLLS